MALTAERLYLYKIRVLRYLSGLPDGRASRAELTRKMLTNIDRQTRNALIADMVRQQLISGALVNDDPLASRRPRTFYSILARGRALYLRHQQKCRNGEMRKLIPGAKP